jgi:hypothetical protein
MKKSAGVMRAMIVTVALFTAAQAAAPRSLPDANAFAASVLAGQIDLEKFDFEAAGFWKLRDDERLPWLSGVQQQVFGTSLSSDTCDAGERRRFAAAMWIMLLQQAGDATTWRANFTALRRTLALHDANIRAAAEAIEPAKDERARVTELRRRVARDQSIRDLPRVEKMSAELPELARSNWTAFQLIRMMSIDCDNTEWLAAQMHEIGWFDIPTYGAEIDNNAWLIVQHADRSKAFQRETLAYLRRLPPGKTDPKNLAYLEDRVASGEGRPQRFGTQGSCTAEGKWVPLPVEDPAGLDSRREDIGLMPMADYIKTFDGVCTAPK